jgi:hypothetical protein
MGPGWAKKVEIFDGSGMGKKSCVFLWVRGVQKNLKFLMDPGWAKKVEIFYWSGVCKKSCILWSGLGKKICIF